MRSKEDIFGITFLVVGALPALLSLLALIGYFIDREGHVFGTEVGGYMYTSLYHYLGLNGLMVALFAAAVAVRNWFARILAVVFQLGLLGVAVVI